MLVSIPCSGLKLGGGPAECDFDVLNVEKYLSPQQVAFPQEMVHWRLHLEIVVKLAEGLVPRALENCYLPLRKVQRDSGKHCFAWAVVAKLQAHAVEKALACCRQEVLCRQ